MTVTELHRYRNRKRRDLNRHLGIPNRLPAEPARQHLQNLRATMSWNHIATESGCSACSLRQIADGRTTRINGVTHAKIMAVQPAPTRDGGFYIDATGSVRRVRALMARGHAQHAIAAAAQTTQTRIALLAAGQQRMRQKLADKIDHAYQQLSHKDGTSTRARNIASARCWQDVSYWEDVDRIDDPAFDPDARDSRTEALGADGIELIEIQRYKPEFAARRLGVQEDTLTQAIRRYKKQLEAA
ncbi:hypothetical protein [Streptomyces noursei]|uniref:hypothetical protein n=1 Tax=Streptomyces noursei TaxID=1971 RepID=UPI00167C1F27|nr:hypothetical protein [Streptomyces noursei]MCZ1014027.1 hypothetical protein [Streptomyces noursei]GGX49289.1 hypothetical protein GCM10010341_83680 [Streptomyces noursei]